jgi:hypothetical protein
MTYRIAFPLLAFLVAGGCGAKDATSPMTEATTPGPTVALSSDRQADDDNDGENSRRSGALHVTKECSMYHGLAGEHCTITSSNLKEIPKYSRVVYEKGAAGGSLDSDLILYAAGRGHQTAFGHVVLNLATGTGVVTFSGGTGKFKTFRARVDVSIAPSGRPNFVWNGTYSFGNKGE